jgi:hypothetical protein
MGCSPDAHPFEVLGAAEVIPVLWLLEPAPLPGGLQGRPARFLRTAHLALGIAPVRLEQFLVSLTIVSDGPELICGHVR